MEKTKSKINSFKVKVAAVKIILSLVLTVVFAALFYQIYEHSYTSVKTQTAVYTQVTEKIETKGYAVRDEQMIYSDTTGVCAYNVADGSRVSTGSTVAYVYPSEEQAEIHRQIKSLSSEIGKLEEINSSENAVFASDLNLLSKEIDDKIIKTAKAFSENDYEAVDGLREQLLYLMTKSNIITKKDSGVEGQLLQLQSRLAALTAAFNTTPTAVGASNTGYFISKVDGYEDILTSEKLFSMTPENFEGTVSSVKGNVREGNVVGKIATGFKWYFACVLDKEDTERLEYKNNNGVNIRLIINSCSDNILPVEVKAVNKNKEGGSLVVFECRNMSEELAGLRAEEATVVLDSYEGIGISSKAVRSTSRDITNAVKDGCEGFIEKDKNGSDIFVIRNSNGKEEKIPSYINPYQVTCSTDKNGKKVFTENNVKTVYVLLANEISEKQINILYSSSEQDLVLCEIMTGTSAEVSRYIKLYDEIAVSGKGLYDGKIVN